MAEREYYCVDCGRTHAASLWYVRQVLSDMPLECTPFGLRTVGT